MVEKASEKVTVSEHDVRLVAERPVDFTRPSAPRPMTKLPVAIPWWARLGLFVVALCFPLLCFLAVVLRVAFRAETPRVKFAWTGFLATLLIVSGMLTLIAGGLVFFMAPVPVITGSGLADLDERTSFPKLPSTAALSGVEASRDLKPLVVVVSPAATRLWSRGEVPSNSFGAGELLHAEKSGYLFVTAKHVAEASGAFGGKASHVLLATQEGTWGSADVIASADKLDLALIWMPRHAGSLGFTQPLTAVSDGANVSVIGHPEGLKYTLSTGIVSGSREQAIQISAAVSPGNSGGPVYDEHGNLAGIVSSKFDRNRDANAENLSFAVKPAALITPDAWHFAAGGREHLQSYIDAVKAQTK